MSRRFPDRRKPPPKPATIEKNPYAGLQRAERQTLAIEQFDVMSSELRCYAGGSLLEADWPMLRGKIFSAVLRIDKIFGFKERP